MSNRKLLILMTGLLIFAGFLWVLALNMPRPSASTAAPQSTRPIAAAVAQSSPTGVVTVVDPPTIKLMRAKEYLRSPLSRDSIDAATLIIKSIPTSAAEHKQGLQLLREAEGQLVKENAANALRIRGQLQAEYEGLLASSNPHLNYITTQISRHKGGFALWGVHSYFSQYTFSIGGDAKVVSAWIDQNRAHLRKANIVRVGVRSKEGWGGSCWFDV